MDEIIELKIEGIDILDGIVAEFESDPMSVQCFDLRVVERAKYVISRLKELDPMF